MGVFYSRSVLLELSFHALTYLGLCPDMIRLDKQHESQACNHDRRDLEKNFLLHFYPPNAKNNCLSFSARHPQSKAIRVPQNIFYLIKTMELIFLGLRRNGGGNGDNEKNRSAPEYF